VTRAPLYGLVLAGGESRRMGRDKAALKFHGRSQVDWAFDLLSRHCEQVFISVRPGQAADPARSSHPAITDRHDGIGPIAGIAAAQAAHPDVAWLVLACDLPFLNDATIATLVSRRGPHEVTAYRSSHDGLPEPLCAVYEPQSRPGLLAAIDGGRNCPRKFIIRSGVPLLEQPDPNALDNVNTPEEFARAQEMLQPHGAG
jgi:molybdopterin-guanine dinucleotide biosynthesis protein A